MKRYLLFLPCLLFACTSSTPQAPYDSQLLLSEMETALTDQLLYKWYPAVSDLDSGGYYSSFTHDWQLGENQTKMIVTQSRHLWTAAKAKAFFPESNRYQQALEQGPPFLQSAMWDPEYGGFYTLVNRSGQALPGGNLPFEKTAYGNAFGIYGLAAHHAETGSQASLKLAKETFAWLEAHSHDPIEKGYFQHLTREGKLVGREVPAPEGSLSQRLGLKDQNSSIHLLEAFTELYQVWPDSLVRERLIEMLTLIRDVIVQEPGYLQLFLTADWQPQSYRDSTEEVRSEHYGWDHVSFGHDVETAFLLLEASEVLGNYEYDRTLEIGKRMVDHSLRYGFDHSKGGFLERGYYYAGEDTLRIIDRRKNWWSQAEGLNALLLFSQLFPEEKSYETAFLLQWEYIKKHLIDPEHGGWYSHGTDESPDAPHHGKGNIWKSAYHNGRSLMHCIHMLRQSHHE